MRRNVSLLMLLALGCRPEEELPVLVSIIDASTPERVEVAPAAGYGTLEVPVLLTNRYGAAVAGAEVELSVEGASADSSTVAIGPTGYGEIELNADAPGAITVTPVGSADGAAMGEAVTCWNLAGALPSWDLRPSWLMGPELDGVTAIMPLLEGVVLATELDVWFLGIQPDARPYRVLSMPDPILEMESLHIDNDGVMDLLVRSVDELVLLRGRAGGGMSWGAGFAAEGMELVGASVDDVDGDTRNDVGFALQGSAGAWLVIMAGDGAWGFEELEDQRFELDRSVVDVELSQSDADGRAEVALLESDSVLMRYYWSEPDEAWVETYPSTLETHLAPPASFLGAADLNAGGADEPILLSHAEPGVQQSMIFYTLDGNTTQYQKSYLAPRWALDDLSGDAIPDIIALEEGDLHIIHFTADEGGADFTYHTLGGVYLRTGTDADEMPESGPIAAGMLDGDGVPDLAMATDALHVFPGKQAETAWASRDGRWTSYDLQLLTEPALVDLDGKAGLETLAGWVYSYSVPVLRTWWIEPGPDGDLPNLERRGEILLEDGAEPLSVAIAGDRVWGLVDFDGVQLIALERTDSDTFDELGRTAVDGAALVPGSFADGAELAVVSAEGGVSWFGASLSVLGTDSVGAWGCIAAADTDGDGIDELHTAPDAGCDLLAVDLDGDGTEELVLSDGDGISVDWADVTHSLEGRGRLAARDLDGDGQPEILAAAGGQVWVHRALGAGFAPGGGLHGATVFGPLAIGDVTGDGLPDLVTVDEDGMWKLLWGVAGEPG
jgi:hypothetical protein